MISDIFSRRILAAHDLSGIGHTSLLAVIAILYRMSVQVASLPTCILSASTVFEGFTFMDFTAQMRQFVAHWKQLDYRFDAIYSGFLGNPDQVEIILDALCLRSPDAVVLIDPVLGDEGALYDCYDTAMIPAMRSLIRQADIITPNSTEASLLAGETLHNEADILAWAKEVSSRGPRHVIISSMPTPDPNILQAGHWNAEDNTWTTIPFPVKPGIHPGSGDCFAAFLLGGIMNGYSVSNAVQAATRIMTDAILAGHPVNLSWREGIALEKVLAGDVMAYFKGMEKNI